MKGTIIDDDALRMTPEDNVATALSDLSKGRTFEVSGTRVELKTDVPFGHKLSLSAIETGENVIKYGEIIGEATESIPPGEWVHTHNCQSTRGRGDQIKDKPAEEGSA